MSNSVKESVESILVVCYGCEPNLTNLADTELGYRTTNTHTFKCINCNSRNIETLPAGSMTITRPEGDEDELEVNVSD